MFLVVPSYLRLFPFFSPFFTSPCFCNKMIHIDSSDRFRFLLHVDSCDFLYLSVAKVSPHFSKRHFKSILIARKSQFNLSWDFALFSCVNNFGHSLFGHLYVLCLFFLWCLHSSLSSAWNSISSMELYCILRLHYDTETCLRWRLYSYYTILRGFVRMCDHKMIPEIFWYVGQGKLASVNTLWRSDWTLSIQIASQLRNNQNMQTNVVVIS